MLGNAHVTTVLPVTQLDRARKFYGELLGLKEGGRSADGGLTYRCGDGGTIHLVPRQSPIKAEYTSLTFEVPDVERTLRDLEKRGIRFEDYETPQLRTVNHVATMGREKAAWFRDSEGNILCLHETH